jgi:two-component system LytT family response regulator
VADYLVKSTSFERFLKQYSAYTTRPWGNSRARVIAPFELPQGLVVKTDQRLVKVDYTAIWYLEGGKDYTTVVTSTKKLFTVSSLTQLANNLPRPQFLRVHKSYIVAFDKISVVERQRIYLDNAVIPFGDTYRAAFAKAVAGY